MHSHHKNVIFFVIFFLSVFYLSLLVYQSLTEYKESPQHWQAIPLPEFSMPLELNVVYAENSRFKTLTDLQIEKILAKAEQLSKEHFFLDLKLRLQRKQSVESLLEKIPDSIKRHMQKKNIVVADNIKTFNRVKNSIEYQLYGDEKSVDKIIEYSKSYFDNTNEITSSNLSSILSNTLIKRNLYWKNEIAEDGQSIVNDSDNHQYVLWDVLGYSDMPYDIVLTNQLVASAEDSGMPVHTCLRGGITGGNMSYSKKGKLNSFVFVSAFQVINNNSVLAQLRNNENYTEEQQIDYIAATITHELGHAVFHYGHPFAMHSCIMNPTPVLHYRQWYQQLDAKDCRNIEPVEQKLGAAVITYNAAW